MQMICCAKLQNCWGRFHVNWALWHRAFKQRRVWQNWIDSYASSKLLVVYFNSHRYCANDYVGVGTEVSAWIISIRFGRLINERLSGLTLKEIRDTFFDRVSGCTERKNRIDPALCWIGWSTFYWFQRPRKNTYRRTKNIIDQPEFIDPKNFRSVIELIENEDIIVSLIWKGMMNHRGILWSRSLRK